MLSEVLSVQSKHELHHWLSIILHVLMTWLNLRSAQGVLGLNPCQWKREDQDLSQREWSRVSVRVSFIVQSDHTYRRGKGYCLCDCRPVCSENRICGLADHKGDKVSACDLTVGLLSRVGQDGWAVETDGFAGKLKYGLLILVVHLEIEFQWYCYVKSWCTICCGLYMALAFSLLFLDTVDNLVWKYLRQVLLRQTF